MYVYINTLVCMVSTLHSSFSISKYNNSMSKEIKTGHVLVGGELSILTGTFS